LESILTPDPAKIQIFSIQISDGAPAENWTILLCGAIAKSAQGRAWLEVPGE
jgi:hypothetical protein